MTKQKHFYLIRGLIREAGHWGDFRHLLQAGFPEAKVTTIDIPGAGVHYHAPSPLSVRKMVEEMRRTIQCQADEDCILVAISLGGMIAGQWLKDHPHDFHRAILINTSYGGISPLTDRLKLTALRHLLKVPTLKGRDKEAHILRLVCNHNSVFDKTLNLWEKIQAERPVSLKNTIRQMAAGAMFRIGKWKPAIPLLLLGSTQDRMVSVNCSRSLSRIWNVPLIEHPTAGHDLTADDPQWVVEQIKNFGNA